MMIYTLTLNTAIDMNLCCERLKSETVNRTRSSVFSPNGKGINVSRILHYYQQPTHVLGIFGGFSGQYIIDELRAEHIPVTPFYCQSPTRINVFINDSQHEYKLVSAGLPVDVGTEADILDYLSDLTSSDSLVISGSLPPGIDPFFYRRVLELCRKTQCEVILDISDPILKELLDEQPLLIKPNSDELKEIFDITVTERHHIPAAMRKLHRYGARNVLLTLGAEGICFSDGSNIWFCAAPPISLVSSACAGDASLGAFLSQWFTTGDITQALTLACATGADVAGSAGLGTLARVPELLRGLKAFQI